MMHVILTILKIIGIILLVLLAILLTVFLLLLFVPMRYRLHVRKQKDLLEIDGRMTWLLHLIRADLNVKQMHGKAVIRAAGFKLRPVAALPRSILPTASYTEALDSCCFERTFLYILIYFLFSIMSDGLAE